MTDDSLAWHKYVYEGKGTWWWCEANGDWFLENSPGPWTQYLDPTSGRQYWWRDDTNWFWINGCHGVFGHSVAANKVADDKHLEQPNLQSPTEPQSEKPLDTAELRPSTPAESLPTPQTESCGARAHWACHVCAEMNNPDRSECNCCGANARPPAIDSAQWLLPAKAQSPLPAEVPSSLSRASAVDWHPGITLLGDCAPAGLAWRYPMRDEKRNSYVGHFQSCLSSQETKAFRSMVMDGMGDLGWDKPPLGARSGSSGGGGARRSGVMTRGTKWLVRRGCWCTYRHKIVNVAPLKATPFPSWMDQLMQACMPACGIADASMWPNSCLLNCYADGSQAIDWHSADESLFGGWSEAGERIISLTLGSDRLYEMRPSDVSVYENVPLSCSLLLKSGDIWTMEGQTPRHYMHRVPKYSGGKNGPVNLHVSFTWR
eukprot:CAMPEP_0117541024 /NCGR_PEP_ID=MMETSP0784-20121206/43802_1 /TAXON_ID=39447 /ORGANISM="" /LENGTH=429 /DNA_ID=CAMNT_0005337699 /DNA_START=68 /DNA_END=1354 /DNA_ORIENTATION=-